MTQHVIYLLCFGYFGFIQLVISQDAVKVDEFPSEFDILPEMTQTRTLPFKIKGPKSKRDKIAIVGAGPAGIHMAYMLKKYGYRNLHILEKSSRIGGKSETINHRGIPHDIGTVYLSPDYHNNVVALVKIYLPNELVLFPAASMWMDNIPGPITYARYLLGFGGRMLGEKNPRVIVMNIAKQIMKYNKLHEMIFGKYEGEIMPEPTAENKLLIRGTFMEFIQRNNLSLLLPIFQVSTTVQGYGHLDEIATLYGLMWNTPNFMKAFLARMSGQREKTGMYMLKSGFQKLWEKIAEDENLVVKFNVDIYRVYRAYKNNCQDVWIYKSENDVSPSWEHYDFLIWSPEMKTSMARWRNVIPEERKLLSSTNPMHFTVSIVDSQNAKRGLSPINYWLDNVIKKRDGSVTAERDTYAVIKKYNGELYQNRTYPINDDNSTYKTSVVYQMSQTLKPDEMLKKTINNYYQNMSATYPNILKTKTWRYFPHYSIEDIENGYLWRILEMQGKYGMWYIGSSVCFESVKSVVEYNKLIVNNMIHPNDV